MARRGAGARGCERVLGGGAGLDGEEEEEADADAGQAKMEIMA